MKELYTRRLRVAALCMLAAVGLCTACPAWAQVLYGSVVGTVVDAQHSAIPLATVRLVSTGTSQSREATTDESGTSPSRRCPAAVTTSPLPRPGSRLTRREA